MSTSAICKDCGHTITLSDEKAVGSGEYQTVWSDDSDWVCKVTGNEHEPGEYTGERDQWGNSICGQDFMAGTICSDEPGHEGGHSAKCQNCGLDWYDESCQCNVEDEDETWKVTYPEKPEWWDDPTEPRCDVCGVHTEEACVYVKDPDVDLDRYPGAWCGECGNCADHCTCDDNPMDPLEALTYAILAINTDQAPDATSGNDLLYLELNAERALAALDRIRDFVIAAGEDLPGYVFGKGEES